LSHPAIVEEEVPSAKKHAAEHDCHTMRRPMEKGQCGDILECASPKKVRAPDIEKPPLTAKEAEPSLGRLRASPRPATARPLERRKELI
jgi:hypothetical protein